MVVEVVAPCVVLRVVAAGALVEVVATSVVVAIEVDPAVPSPLQATSRAPARRIRPP
jgi:hypothetical protein